MSESFAELFEQSHLEQKLTPGQIVSGNILSIQDDVAIVDVGLKSVGVVSLDQFYDETGEVEVAVGDNVEVMLESADQYGAGEVVLSRRKAKSQEAWDELSRSFENDEVVLGTVVGKVKGGYTVDMQSVRAFLPRSLVGGSSPEISTFEKKPQEFKIIKIDKQRNNIVVSRKALVQTENNEEREALLSTLEDGQEITGIVKNLTDYGAFIDLGGLDGLLHITDMSWKRIKHPSEVIKVGEELRVKVLKFDRERMRVSLGLKQMGEDPWQLVNERYPLNARLKGRVTNVTDYGCFVELEDGVEGLVHVSEMDWTNKNANPHKVVKLDQEVEVMVLEVDGERRRISLGLKQCVDNPWDAFINEHQKGDIIKGNIRSITDFGLFIGLPGNIDGLVHLSDISWVKPGEYAVREFKRGQEIEAMILTMDPERERISLGIKQMEEDPFAGFFNDHPKGSIITVKVTEVEQKGAVVHVADNLQGYIRSSEIAKEKVEDARERLNVDEEVDAKVMGVDRKGRGISLSIRARDQDAISKVNDDDDAGEGATLGDLFKEQVQDDSEQPKAN